MEDKIIGYKLLSMAISYPEKEIAEAIDTGWLFTNLKEVFNNLNNKKNLNLIDNLEDEYTSIEDLQVIYTSIFDLKIPLYESHYVVKSDKPEDRAKFLLSLEKLYLEEGVALADRDMPDYLPTELEFAHYLSSEKKLEKLKYFENTHLKNWLPELNKKIEKEDIKFYKNILKIIQNFV